MMLAAGCHRLIWDGSSGGGREGRRVCLERRPPAGRSEGRSLGGPGRGVDSLLIAGLSVRRSKPTEAPLSFVLQLNLASQSVLEGLNACFDHRAEIYIPELGMSFQVQQKTKIFGCQNPFTQGGGRKGLPKSFLNRFTQVTALRPVCGCQAVVVIYIVITC